MSKNNILVKCNIPYILNGEFYEIIALDGENVTVRCCHCESRNIYKGSIRSTGNFHMHIKRKHPILLPRVQEVKLNSFINRKVVSRKRSVGRISSVRMSVDHDDNKRIDNVSQLFAQYPGPSSVQAEPQNLSSSASICTKHQPEIYEPEEVKTENSVNIIDISEKSLDASKGSPSTSQTEEKSPKNEAAPENEKPQWDEVLCRLENLMKGVERELRLRNQIETNRLFMELAKFKYLHPHFNFNT